MQRLLGLRAWPKELGAVVLVAAAVTMAFTVAASMFDQFHQVAAEDLRSSEASAVAGGSNTQVLTLKDWGVTLTVPLGGDMPTVKYTTEGPDSVGLSSTTVEKSGAACSAAQNAIGAVVRVPAATDITSLASQVRHSLGTIGDYLYLYETPASACAATQSASTANNEAMILDGYAVLNPL